MSTEELMKTPVGLAIMVLLIVIGSAGSTAGVSYLTRSGDTNIDPGELVEAMGPYLEKVIDARIVAATTVDAEAQQKLEKAEKEAIDARDRATKAQIAQSEAELKLMMSETSMRIRNDMQSQMVQTRDRIFRNEVIKVWGEFERWIIRALKLANVEYDEPFPQIPLRAPEP